MNQKYYYIMIDNSVQWFYAIACFDENVQTGEYRVVDFVDIPMNVVNTLFVGNLFDRKQSFGNRDANNRGWAGVAISKIEFNRVNEMTNLNKYVERFNDLAKI